MFLTLPKWLFGNDIFISYKRDDGGKAALALASACGTRKRQKTAFVDQFAAQPRPTLPKPLVRAILSARVFVVLMTRGAINSDSVLEEIRHFDKTGRTTVVVSFVGDAWKEKEELHRLIGGADGKCYESPEAWTPDDPLLSLIEQSVGYWSQRRRIWISALLASALIVLSIIFSFFLSQSIKHAQRKLRALEDAAVTYQQIDEAPRESLASTLRAYTTYDLPETRAALLNSLLHNAYLRRYIPLPKNDGKEAVSILHFSPEPRTQLHAAMGRRLLIWSPYATKPPKVLEIKHEISAIASSDEFNALLSNGGDKINPYIVLFDNSSSPKVQRRFSLSNEYFSKLIYAEKDYLIGFAPFKGIAIWKISSGKETWIEQWDKKIENGPIAAMQSSNQVVVAFGRKNSISLFTPVAQEKWRESTLLQGGRPRALALDSNEHRLLEIQDNGAVWERNLSTGIERQLSIVEDFQGTAILSSNGSKLAYQNFSSGVHIRLDISKKDDLKAALSNRTISKQPMAFSPDGKLLAVRLYGGDIGLWDFNRGPLGITRIDTLPENVITLSFDHTTGTFAALLWEEDTSKLWIKSANAFKVINLNRFVDAFPALSVCPQPRQVPQAGNTFTQAWQIADAGGSHDPSTLIRIRGSKIETIELQDCDFGSGRVALSSDGRYLAHGSGGFHLIDLAPAIPRPIKRVKLSGKCECKEGSPIAFDRNNQLVAVVVGNYDRIEIWHLWRQELIARIVEHDYDQIWCLAFSPDGRTLAVGLMGGMLHLWDISGDESDKPRHVRRLNPRYSLQVANVDQALRSISFSPDGDHIFVTNSEGVYTVPGSPTVWRKLARQRLGSSLTEEK